MSKLYLVFSAILALSEAKNYGSPESYHKEDSVPEAYFSGQSAFISYETSASITVQCKPKLSVAKYTVTPRYNTVRFRLSGSGNVPVPFVEGSPLTPNLVDKTKAYFTGVGTNIVLTGISKGDVATQFLMDKYDEDYHVFGNRSYVLTIITSCLTPKNYTIQYFSSGIPVVRKHSIGSMTMPSPYGKNHVSFGCEGPGCQEVGSLDIIAPFAKDPPLVYGTLNFTRVEVAGPSSDGTCNVSRINVFRYLINKGYVRLATICSLPQPEFILPGGVGLVSLGTNPNYTGRQRFSYYGELDALPIIPK